MDHVTGDVGNVEKARRRPLASRAKAASGRSTSYGAMGAALVAILSSAPRAIGASTETETSTHVGEAVTIGNGTGHTVVETDGAGKPVSLAIALSETALSGLPAAKDVGAGDPFPTYEYVLPLPAGVSVPPFRHVVLNWNPRGHIPPHVYDLPHFDFHFYVLTPEQRSKITATGADLAIVQQKPAAKYLPQDYIYAPGGEQPRMGAHWVNPAGSEFHAQPFAHTFVYGTYAGKLAFVEPMASRAFLEGRPDVGAPIEQPAAFEVKGYYPRRYSVRYDATAKEYRVELSELQLHEVSR